MSGSLCSYIHGKWPLNSYSVMCFCLFVRETAEGAKYLHLPPLQKFFHSTFCCSHLFIYLLLSIYWLPSLSDIVSFFRTAGSTIP